MSEDPISIALKKWFSNSKRDLPWRKNISPYGVWVSEIMLQQTQVKTVIPYYNRWMEAFPSIEALANTPLEKVIKHWEGLGYYSRARNLHKGAKMVCNLFNANLPDCQTKLKQIPGIGPYTLGAILSFAFHKKSILIDGNVKRVISRLFCLKLNFSETKNYRKLEKVLESLLPEKEPWIFNEALMELGALICTPSSPNCQGCPLNNNCEAFQSNLQNQLPLKTPRKKIVKLYRLALIIEHQEKRLVRKQDSELMQDLYEYPYVELKSEKELLNHPELKRWNQISSSCHWIPVVTHSFTHHRVKIFAAHIVIKKKREHQNYQWLSKKELAKKPFSAGHRKLMRYLD